MKQITILVIGFASLVSAQLDVSDHSLSDFRITRRHLPDRISESLGVRDLDEDVVRLVPRGRSKKPKNSGSSETGSSSSISNLRSSLSSMNLAGASSPSPPVGVALESPRGKQSQKAKSPGPFPRLGQTQGQSSSQSQLTRLGSSPDSSSDSPGMTPVSVGSTSHKSPRTRELEQAQANIAREHPGGPSSPLAGSPLISPEISRTPSPLPPPADNSRPGSRSSSPSSNSRPPSPPPPAANAATAGSRTASPSRSRSSSPGSRGPGTPADRSPQASSSQSNAPPTPETQLEHKEWLDGAKTDVRKADDNARAARAYQQRQRVRGPITPPSEKARLQTIKTEARNSRVEARRRASAAAEALGTRRAHSPTTKRLVDESIDGGIYAHTMGTVHWSEQRQAAIVANDGKRWRDVSKYIQTSARGVTRTEANDAYHAAQEAQYEAKLRKEDAQGLPADASPDARSKALGRLVKSNAAFKKAGEHYDTKHAQYQETRTTFPDGSSSEEEKRPLPGAATRRQRG